MPRLLAPDIARSLGQRIDAGEWSNGHRIPPERELATGYGVARNTVRRAMLILGRDGAVSRHVGRGTFVTRSAGAELGAIVARIEGAGPADMMEIRLLIEPSAAAFAATNASLPELARVEEAHQSAADATDMPRFEQWDAEFHHRIIACSRNELLKDLHELLTRLRNQAPWHDMKRRSFTEERRLAYCDEHAAIANALQRRDPDGARSAMLGHLKTVEANMLGR